MKEKVLINSFLPASQLEAIINSSEIFIIPQAVANMLVAMLCAGTSKDLKQKGEVCFRPGLVILILRLRIFTNLIMPKYEINLAIV